MTPLPSKEELASRPLFDPPTGAIHVQDLVKLTIRKKNRLSDLWVGVLVFAAHLKIITKTQGDIFESDFVQGLKIRKTRIHVGEPFRGPDGLVLVVQEQVLHGNQPGHGVSPFNLQALHTHPNYGTWLNATIFGGSGQDGAVCMSPGWSSNDTLRPVPFSLEDGHVDVNGVNHPVGQPAGSLPNPRSMVDRSTLNAPPARSQNKSDLFVLRSHYL